MMRRMGEDARTDYAWGDDLARKISIELEDRIPVGDIAAWQVWRDKRILAARAAQVEGTAQQPR